MTHNSVFRCSVVAALTMLVWSPVARAQTPSASSARPSASAVQASGEIFEDPRPATTTFLGDTGIWYVPTAEILRSGRWSVAGDRRGTNYVQGSTNVADFAGSLAVGIGSHVEVFGAFLFDTRINRNAPPVFDENDSRDGGVIARFPRVNQSWTGDNVGDLYVGSKFNILSQYRQSPVALAVRGLVKFPTGDEEVGNSSGKMDGIVDVIVSGEAARFVEMSMYAGYERRGAPDNLLTPAGAYRWGTGMMFPSRSPLRFSAEVNGDLPSNYRAVLTGPLVQGEDGSLPPFESDIRNRTRATGGLTYSGGSGFFVGTGLSWNAPRYWDWQVRIGYHGRGKNAVRSLAAAEPVAPAPVAEAPAPVEAPRAETIPPPFTPAPEPAPAPVQAATPRRYTFDDIYFDFDGYTLRAEAMPILDDAARAMMSDSTLFINIEGHTCNIGTGEYNEALSGRRANAVRDYFMSRGLNSSRVRTSTFGENDPEHSNAHEETRRLNRRVALVVRLEP